MGETDRGLESRTSQPESWRDTNGGSRQLSPGKLSQTRLRVTCMFRFRNRPWSQVQDKPARVLARYQRRLTPAQPREVEPNTASSDMYVPLSKPTVVSCQGQASQSPGAIPTEAHASLAQ